LLQAVFFFAEHLQVGRGNFMHLGIGCDKYKEEKKKKEWLFHRG
jgi:hypothetical protein